MNKITLVSYKLLIVLPVIFIGWLFYTMPHMFYSERSNEFRYENFLLFPFGAYYIFLTLKRLKNKIKHNELKTLMTYNTLIFAVTFFSAIGFSLPSPITNEIEDLDIIICFFTTSFCSVFAIIDQHKLAFVKS